MLMLEEFRRKKNMKLYYDRLAEGAKIQGHEIIRDETEVNPEF